MRAYAAVPIAEHLRGTIFRIYFSSRDDQNRSHTGWIVIDLMEPQRILDISYEPVVGPGELGCFDDSGAMATWLTTVADTRYLYYIGWNLGVTVPFRNSIGLAVSHNGGRFTRYAMGPIVDRTPTEPHFTASCCVLQDEGVWRMWYLSCVGWTMHQGRPRHHYHLKYATSLNGINWERNGHIAIDFASTDEFAISRPSVIRDRELWRIWYSYRGERYRIGYAESEDGITWTRRDHEVGIDVSPSGWDSEMIEYPHVFDHEGRRYMVYNGNDYGRTGFGLAVLD